MRCHAEGCAGVPSCLKGTRGGVCRTHLKLVPADVRTAHAKATADVRRIAAWPLGGANAVALRMAQDRLDGAQAAVVRAFDHDVPPDIAVFLAETGFGRDEPDGDER